MRSTRIGKKAQVEEHLIHFAIMFYVIYIIIVLVIVINIFLRTTIDIDETELRIITSRMLHEASAYDKETGRTYAGIIDSSALNEEKMNKAIYFGKERRLGAKIKAGDTEIDYNSKWLERLKPRVGYDVKKAETNAYMVYNGEGKTAKIEAVQ